uniref:F-box associated domain-containing protein n=1 Tax=Leersia perrieri TaxID=77586 RepID=A0A0D9W0V7_9ORYZ
MDPPDRIPTERFWMRLAEDEGGRVLGRWKLFGCRHGRVLLFNREKKVLVLWDPDTGDHRRVAVPPEIDGKQMVIWNGSVLCAAAAADGGHVHGGFSSCPFKVAVVGVNRDETQMFSCVYSSETGKWSNIIFAVAPFVVFAFAGQAVLGGNALYWLPVGFGHCILKLDLDRHTLAVIERPSNPNSIDLDKCQIILAEDGSLGFATLSNDSLQMWERKVLSEGVSKWVVRKTYELNKVLDLGSGVMIRNLVKMGYADDINVIFLLTNYGVFMLQLDTLQSKKL